MAPAAPTDRPLSVALLSNGKDNGSRLLELVAQRLGAHLDVRATRLWRKGSVSIPPSPQQLEEIRAFADVVVAAIGDCGSCSSRTMRDCIDFEWEGIPSVAIIADALTNIVDAMRRLSGMPDYPYVVTRYPVGQLGEDELAKRADELAPQIARLLTTGRPSAQDGASRAARSGAADRAPDPLRTMQFASNDAALEHFFEVGWTDGLPVTIPRVELVDEALELLGRPPDEVLFRMPTRDDLAVTVGAVAVNAVMAGCRPEYLPTVVAAVEAIGDPRFNLHSNSATLSGAQQVLIVNGPARTELGFNSGDGALGPGTRANATVGRAVRLVIRNVCLSRHGEFDRSGFSHPGRYTWCIAEAEEHSPWPSLAEQVGLPAGVSAVSAYATTFQAFVGTLTPDPEEFFRLLARALRHTGLANEMVWREGGPLDSVFHDTRPFLFVTGREHMRVLAENGYHDLGLVKERIFEGMAGVLDGLPPLAVVSPDNIKVVYVHGTGHFQTWFLAPAFSHELVTRPVRVP